MLHNIAPDHQVRTSLLATNAQLPLLIMPESDQVDLHSWVKQQQEWIKEKLTAHGGILFRGFSIHSLERFQSLVANLSDDLLDYTYRSTPRSQISGKVYTSTEYSPDQHIPPHNEMSYTNAWPGKIWFCCLQAAAEGGETPIVDSHRVYERLPHDLRQRFVEQGVMYVRNYGSGLDLPWQDVFQTANKDEVADFCEKGDIEYEWLPGDRLRTIQVCQAIIHHPQTGLPLWFNQAHLFHISSLPEDVQMILLDAFDIEDLPRNTYYGDGSPIEMKTLEVIRQAYEAEKVTFPWQEGDVLMLDNMLVAHGRNPFVGPRRIVVAMAEKIEADAFAESS